jgi:uncharacterized protein (TIRG00374 family)
MKKWMPIAARSLISIGLLILLFMITDLSSLGEILRKANIGILVGIVLWLLLDRMLHAWRWILLLKAKMSNVSTGFLIRIHFISNFIANFLPFNIGNDVTRVVSLAKYTEKLQYPISSVIVDRLLGAFSLVISAGIIVMSTTLLNSSVFNSKISYTISISLIAMVLVSYVVVKSRIIPKILRMLIDKTPNKLLTKILQTYDACLSYKNHARIILAVMIILLISVINGILISFFTARALGINVPLIYFFLFMPIISFISLLPISANGIGISEGGFVFFFAGVGATSTEALTLGIVLRILMIIATLPGGFLLAIGGIHQKKIEKIGNTG